MSREKQSDRDGQTFSSNCYRKTVTPSRPPPRKKVGSCLILRNELSEETHGLTKQETLLGRRAQENGSAPWLVVLGFTVLELPSGLSLANH